MAHSFAGREKEIGLVRTQVGAAFGGANYGAERDLTIHHLYAVSGFGKTALGGELVNRLNYFRDNSGRTVRAVMVPSAPPSETLSLLERQFPASEHTRRGNDDQAGLLDRTGSLLDRMAQSAGEGWVPVLVFDDVGKDKETSGFIGERIAVPIVGERKFPAVMVALSDTNRTPLAGDFQVRRRTIYDPLGPLNRLESGIQLGARRGVAEIIHESTHGIPGANEAFVHLIEKKSNKKLGEVEIGEARGILDPDSIKIALGDVVEPWLKGLSDDQKVLALWLSHLPLGWRRGEAKEILMPGEPSMSEQNAMLTPLLDQGLLRVDKEGTFQIGNSAMGGVIRGRVKIGDQEGAYVRTLSALSTAYIQGALDNLETDSRIRSLSQAQEIEKFIKREQHS